MHGCIATCVVIALSALLTQTLHDYLWIVKQHPFIYFVKLSMIILVFAWNCVLYLDTRLPGLSYKC